MTISRFMKEHKALWSELEALISSFQKQPKSMSAQQIDRLTELYKKVSTHYSYAQTAYPQDEVTIYLNHLVTRTHHLLFKQEYRSTQQLSDFFLGTFIELIRKRHRFILFAIMLFVLGALSGFLAVQANPLNLYFVIPGEMAAQIDPERVGEGHDQISHPIMSTYIMTNNIRVAILAFVGGITFGILTFYVLVYNGVLLGAIFALFLQAGQSYIFWAYILPHGIIELTVIFVAGGAGLLMGYRMWVPGPYSRLQQLTVTAKESLLLLLGTFPLFVIAGLIEGYITPSTTLSLEMKYAFAGGTLIFLILYYLYGLRRAYSASFDLSTK